MTRRGLFSGKSTGFTPQPFFTEIWKVDMEKRESWRSRTYPKDHSKGEKIANGGQKMDMRSQGVEAREVIFTLGPTADPSSGHTALRLEEETLLSVQPGT